MRKGIGDKVLGWFIVQDELNADTDANAAHAKANADVDDAGAHGSTRPPVRAPAPASVVAPGAAHDARAFAAVYRAAGVDEPDRERLARVVALIESLPSEASVDVKRAIVAASLEAFGVVIDRILVTGEATLAALEGYVADGGGRTKEVLAAAEARIVKLTADIAEVRRLMDLQVAAQQDLARAVTTEMARVRGVLDFFGGTSRTAAPGRLVRLK